MTGRDAMAFTAALENCQRNSLGLESSIEGFGKFMLLAKTIELPY